MATDELRLREVQTAALTTAELTAIRSLMDVAFGSDEDERFTDEDWAHSIGGIHVVLDRDGSLVAHASIVEREIHLDGVPLRTGYVEAVATDPPQQGAGHGTLVMEAVATLIRSSFELGMLGTGAHRFYERLGWETLTGPAFVRTADATERTRDEEGFLLVLRTPTSPPFELNACVSCEWRPGDVW